MLTDEEREQIDLACIADWKRGWSGIHPDRHNINATVKSIIAARVRAARAQELRDAAEQWWLRTDIDNKFSAFSWLRDRAETIDNGLG